MDIRQSEKLTKRVKLGDFAYNAVIDDICRLDWGGLSSRGLTNVAWGYYFFSTQFRENLEIACSLYIDDKALQELDRGERNTDNLSPWPGVAAPGEKMHHDEFMRRTLTLTPIEESQRRFLETCGQSYLARIRKVETMTRAISIASYEDGGLEAVFKAILIAPTWDSPLLKAFNHFLVEHIKFDSHPDSGHGALCRHLTPDDRILPLWTAFRQLLVETAPELDASSSW